MRDLRRVGLISDTHGRIRPQALDALAGCSLILHAGDVGGGRVLEALRTIAPVHAVRGNVDDPYEPGLHDRLDLDVDGCRLHVVHGHQLGTPTPERLATAVRADVIVFGHTHRPVVESVRGQLVVNPGSAGPSRFGLPVSIAILTVSGGRADARIVRLDGTAGAPGR
jgi:hypothetical protein